MQTFKVEANYPNHRYTSSVGGFVTQIPVSIHVRSPISEKVTLMGRSGFTYNFYNGAESYSGRTATASTQTWSVDKHMDVLTTLSAGYFGEFGVILPRVTPGAELQWAISYHGIPQSVMEGELVHTSETGKVEDYYYHAQGNYMALEVSYHYNLKTGLKAEKEHMPAHQSVYLEIGGAGGFYSVNYDHIFFNKRFFKGGARLGLEFIPQSVASDLPDVGVPLSLNGLLFETHDHHIEVGLGQTITTSNSIDVSVTKATYKRQLTLSATSFIGYRYQQNQGGFLFRGGYSPLWINYDQVNHWLGISFGTSF